MIILDPLAIEEPNIIEEPFPSTSITKDDKITVIATTKCSLASVLASIEEKSVFLKLFTDRTLSFIKWSIHYVDNLSGKHILFSQMTIVKQIPILQKQIIVDEETILYLYGQMHIPDTIALPTVYSSKDDLCKAVDLFEKTKICIGGPNSNAYSDIINITECACVDYAAGCWRHIKCQFLINGSNLDSCNFCDSLFKRFNRNRVDSKNVKKRIRNTGFDFKNMKNEIKKDAVEKNNLKRLATRRNKTIEILKKKVSNLEAELEKLCECDLSITSYEYQVTE